MDNLMYDIEKARQIIEAPLKSEWIKERVGGKGPGGKEIYLSYIEGARVKQLLNEAFNYQWSWEILECKIVESTDRVFKRYGETKETIIPQPPYVIVKGRLSVPGLGYKEAFGSKVIQAAEGADQQSQAVKSASTDALKVAASYFGIALELYFGDEVGDSSSSKPVDSATKSTSAKKTWDPVDTAKLKDLRSKLGIADNEMEKLNPIISKATGGTLTTYLDITPDNIKALIKEIEKELGK